MKKIKVTKYHIIAFAIPFIISLIAIIIGGFAPFGYRDVLSSSGNEEIATYIYKLYDYLHGNYKSNDINAIWSFFLSDPSNLLIMVAPPQLILSYVNFIYILKLAFSGVTFFILLSNKNYSDDAITDNKSDVTINILNIILSSAYSLSGYMLGKGMNIAFLSAVILLPLIVLYVEKLVNSGKWKYYYLVLTISFICNVYMTIVISIFTLLYFFTLNYKDIKHFIKSLYIKTLADILSIGSSAFIIVPALKSSKQLGVLYSEVPLSMNITSFWDVIRRLFVFSEPSSYTDTAYGIDLYSGVFALLILLVYAFSPKIDIYTKLKKLSLIALIFVSTNIIGLNTVFNAFMADHLNFCNFSFEFVLLVLLLCHEAIYSLKEIKISHVIYPFVFTVVLIVLSMIFSNTYLSTRPFIVSLELVFVYSVLMLLQIIKSKGKGIFYIISVITLIEIAITYVNGLSLISNKEINYINTFSCSEYIAEQTIKSKNPDALIVSYNIYDDYFNPVFNSINGIDYVITPSGTDNPDSCLEYTESIGVADIYKNTAHMNNPIYVESDIKNWSFSNTSPYKSSETLFSYVTGQEISLFKKTDVTFDNYTQIIKDDAGAENSERHDQTFGYTPNESGQLYSCFFRPKYVGNAQNSNTIVKTYDVTSKYSVFDMQLYNFYNFDLDTYIKEIAILNQQSDNSAINKQNNGYLINNIGKAANYRYSIDGKMCNPICIDNSLWVTPISSGKHSIEKTQSSSFSLLYLLISFIVVGISIVLIYQNRLKEKNSYILKRVRCVRYVYNFICDNYVYFVTIAVSIGIFILACLLRSCIPFGNESILASDGYVQTYPNIQGMASNFKFTLDAFKLSTIGFGTMIFSSGIDPIASYIGFIIQLFFKAFIKTSDGRMYGALIAGFYYILSGPSMIFYLTHKYSGIRFKKSDSRLIVLGLFFNLSAYIIGFYTFSCFQYGIYVPFIILALERLIYKNKPFAYIFILAYIILRGYYTALLLCEFLILFFIIQDFESFKDFIYKGIRFALSSILAACLAISTLLPALNTVQGSKYAEQDAEQIASTGISLTSTIFKSFSQYQSAHIGVVSCTDDQMVNIYIGLIPLFFLAVFIANNKLSKIARIKKGIILFILYYAFGNTTLNYIFHGFHFQSNVPNRFAIFFIFLILNTFSETIQDIEKLSYKRIYIPTIITSVLAIILWAIYPEKQLQSTIFTTIFASFYMILSIYSYVKKTSKNHTMNILLYISLFEIVIGAVITFQSCIGYSNRILENNNASIQSMINKEKSSIAPNDIFIAENITSSYDNLNMGNANGYSTISGFASGLGSSVYDMTQTWGIFASNNIIKYGTGNPLADMMLHVKYQFIDTDSDEYGNASIYNKIETMNNMEMYENPYYLPISFMTNNNLKKWSETCKTDYNSMVDYQNAFSQAVCEKDIYTIIGTTDSKESSNYQNIVIDTVMNESNSYGTNDMNVHIEINNDIKGKLYSLSETEIIYIGDANDKKSFDYTIYNYTRSELGEIVPIYIAVLNEDVLSEIHSTFYNNICKDVEKTNTSISFNITAANNQIMYVSIPNNSNLELLIDGKKTARYTYLAGIGADLEPGNHHVEIRCPYNPINLGTIITILSLIVTIVIFIYHRRHSQ